MLEGEKDKGWKKRIGGRGEIDGKRKKETWSSHDVPSYRLSVGVAIEFTLRKGWGGNLKEIWFGWKQLHDENREQFNCASVANKKWNSQHQITSYKKPEKFR